MSAWLCSQDHLNLIVNSHPSGGSEEDFNMLRAENLRSLRARYGVKKVDEGWDDEDTSWAKTAAGFQYEKIDPVELVKRVYDEQDERTKQFYPASAKPVTPQAVHLQVITSCASYDYQACETDDYQDTPAAKFVTEAAKKAAKATGFNLEDGDLPDGCLWSF